MTVTAFWRVIAWVSLEHHCHIAADNVVRAKAAIVLGSRKPEIAVTHANRHRQVLQAILNIDGWVEQSRTIAAKANPLGGGTLQLEHAIFTGRTPDVRIVI